MADLKQVQRKRRQTKYKGVVNPQDGIKKRLQRKPSKELLDYSIYEHGLDKALTLYNMTSKEAELILFGADNTDDEPTEQDND